jgi:nicotinate-nucleotide pyrophosphorylase (carboxylating)
MVRLIKKYNAQLFDTRKTIPGLRIAQKYAVRIGGGENQRLGLYDQILIKENHIKSFINLSYLLDKAKLNDEFDRIQIEVENLSQLKKVLSYGIKNILLDNFSVSKIKEAIKINKNRSILEASGNIDKNNIADFAKTGVDRISVGLITKNIHSIDFSMDIDRK